jgi:SAM-dependent methyltransferase/methyltransferase-like protein
MAAEDFEHLPYPSLPQAYTQPSHLAALAHLHGLTAPAAETARVLELGCASGGNIIALAARFPGARFLGVDLAARHIADGQRRIRALGLSNIELRQGDVSRITFGSEQFDYIICHGLYSWVPPDVQDAILKLISTRLAPNGIAAVSYNVLPGWHLRRVVRDLFLQYAGTSGPPAERVARGRHALQSLIQSSNGQQLYGQMLLQEAKRLTRQPAAYILGEFLSEHNHPCLFSEFSGRASQHHLAFLCEGDLGASANENLNSDVGSSLQDLITAQGGGEIASQQAIDFASGRPFRRSVLVHANSTFDAPKVDRMCDLHVIGQLCHDAKNSNAYETAFRDGFAHGVVVQAGSVSAAVQGIADAYPSSIAVNNLLPGRSTPEDQQITTTLLNLVSTGQLRLLTLAVRVGHAEAGKPAVLPLNRLEAADGQPWITSLVHEAVPVDQGVALVVQHLDGKCDRAALADRVAVAHRKMALRQTPAQFVETTLAYLEREAVLISSDADGLNATSKY